MRKFILLAETLADISEDVAVDSLVRRYQSAKALATGGSTDGEREAGSLAMQRLADRAKEVIPGLTPEEQDRLNIAMGWKSAPNPTFAAAAKNWDAAVEKSREYQDRYKSVPIEDILPTRYNQTVTLVGAGGWCEVTMLVAGRQYELHYNFAAPTRDEVFAKVRKAGFTPTQVTVTGQEPNCRTEFKFRADFNTVARQLLQGGFAKSPH